MCHKKDFFFVFAVFGYAVWTCVGDLGDGFGCESLWGAMIFGGFEFSMRRCL